MNLHDYDDRCVRIIDNNSDIFDGICSYNNAEYDEHEFGRNEESLQICNFLFYKSDIKEIQSLENNDGPYGKFLAPYGKLEEMINVASKLRNSLSKNVKKQIFRIVGMLLPRPEIV